MKRLNAWLSVFIRIVAIFIIIFMPLTFLVDATPSVSAQRLPTPTIGQRLSPPVDGDNGAYNCTAASFTMVLQTLHPRGEGDEANFARYLEVRAVLRSNSAVPLTNRGIGFDKVGMYSTQLSDGKVVAVPKYIDSTTWRADLETELAAGYPVMAHINDVGFLPKGYPDADIPAAHAIVITGLDGDVAFYNDPWDGESYEISVDQLGQAWANNILPTGKTSYGWYGMFFRVVPETQQIIGTPSAAQATTAPVPTPSPDLSGKDIVQRSAMAIEQAGSFRYEMIDVYTSVSEPVQTGEVDITDRAMMRQSSFHSQSVLFCKDGYCYESFEGGTPGSDWTIYQIDESFRMHDILDLGEISSFPDDYVMVKDIQTSDDIAVYVLDVRQFPLFWGPSTISTLFIDASTFLPIRLDIGIEESDGAITLSTRHNFSDWGAPITIQIPLEALEIAEATRVAEETRSALPSALIEMGPATVHQSLMTSNLYDDVLPLGFSNFKYDQRTGEDYTRFPGAYGAVSWTSQDESHGLIFVTFETESYVADAIYEAATSLQRQGAYINYPPGFDYPITCFSIYANGQAISGCMVQIGNVLIVSGSVLTSGVQAQADTNAIDLARSGINHLEMVVESSSESLSSSADEIALLVPVTPDPAGMAYPEHGAITDTRVFEPFFTSKPQG